MNVILFDASDTSRKELGIALFELGFEKIDSLRGIGEMTLKRRTKQYDIAIFCVHEMSDFSGDCARTIKKIAKNVLIVVKTGQLLARIKKLIPNLPDSSFLRCANFSPSQIKARLKTIIKIAKKFVPKADPCLNKKRILIVDDEHQFVDILADAFSKEGAHVSTANNGQFALDMVKRHHPEAILVDLKMPILSGLNFIETLHRDSFPMDKIVVLSAFIDSYQLKRLKLLRVSRVLVKPTAIDKVTATVADTLAVA